MSYLLVLSMVLTYLFINYAQPVLDVMYEVFKNEKTFDLELQQLKLQTQKYDVMRKYPEMYKESADNVVGFRYEQPEEYYDDSELEEEYDVEDKIMTKSENIIGYKYQGKIK